MSWNHYRKQGRKTSSVIDKALEAQSRKVWELKTPKETSHGEAFTHFEFYLQELEQVLTVNTREKSFVLFQGEGKSNRLKYPDILFFFSKVYPQGKLVNYSLTCFEFIRA